MMLGALVYLISPVDLIPDLLVGPGLLDELRARDGEQHGDLPTARGLELDEVAVDLGLDGEPERLVVLAGVVRVDGGVELKHSVEPPVRVTLGASGTE